VGLLDDMPYFNPIHLQLTETWLEMLVSVLSYDDLHTPINIIKTKVQNDRIPFALYIEFVIMNELYFDESQSLLISTP